MLFIRTFDNVEIQGTEDNMIVFEKCNRKGNIVVKPQLKQNEIVYHEDELLTKMIPIDERQIFESKPIYILETEHVSLIFQDPNNICHFLVFEEDGSIKPTTFIDLTEDDEILLYDSELKDYYLSPMTNLFVSDGEDIVLHERLKAQLSDYVLYSAEHGVIINNIYII